MDDSINVTMIDALNQIKIITLNYFETFSLTLGSCESFINDSITANKEIGITAEPNLWWGWVLSTILVNIVVGIVYRCAPRFKMGPWAGGPIVPKNYL